MAVSGSRKKLLNGVYCLNNHSSSIDYWRWYHSPAVYSVMGMTKQACVFNFNAIFQVNCKTSMYVQTWIGNTWVVFKQKQAELFRLNHSISQIMILIMGMYFLLIYLHLRKTFLRSNILCENKSLSTTIYFYLTVVN